jgi:hypothetical protein
VLVFSTGELTLGTFLGKKDDAEGRKKRLVDIAAEIRPGSSFETIPSGEITEAGARFYGATARYHGAVGEKWQQYLVNLGPAMIREQLHMERSAWMALPELADLVANTRHPQTRSVVKRFALMAAALRMAIKAHLLPWKVTSADAAIAACARRWAETRGDLDASGEVLRAVNRIRTALNATLSSRFVRLQKNDAGKYVLDELNTDELAGYLKDDRILIRPAAWSQLCAGSDGAAVVEYLRARGWLIPGETPGKPKKERIGEKQSERFYVLQHSFLSSGTGNGERGQRGEEDERSDEEAN